MKVEVIEKIIYKVICRFILGIKRDISVIRKVFSFIINLVKVVGINNFKK